MEKKKAIILDDDQKKMVGGGSGGPYDFDHVHCPRCKSTNIVFDGFIADGEIAVYNCRDCHFHHEEFA